MQIRVAILDQDQNYQNRVLVALREKFSKNYRYSHVIVQKTFYR